MRTKIAMWVFVFELSSSMGAEGVAFGSWDYIYMALNHFVFRRRVLDRTNYTAHTENIFQA